MSLELRKPRIDDYGIVVEHDMACAVCKEQKAVYLINHQTFLPCWECQHNGWQLIHAPILIKFLRLIGGVKMIEDLKQVRDALEKISAGTLELWRKENGSLENVYLHAYMEQAEIADQTIATLDSIIAESARLPTISGHYPPLVPDGYKLVDTKNPITSEMKAACIGEFSFTTEEPLINEDWEYTGEKYDRENVVPWDLCKKIYKTMLYAAPQPPAKGGE